jgi:hypothetical protein
MSTGPGRPELNVMTALNQAAVTELIDQTFENIRRGTDRQ